MARFVTSEATESDPPGPSLGCAGGVAARARVAAPARPLLGLRRWGGGKGERGRRGERQRQSEAGDADHDEKRPSVNPGAAASSWKAAPFVVASRRRTGSVPPEMLRSHQALKRGESK